MRILLLSDLHRDYWRKLAPTIDALVSKPDVVVLAGDIHTKGNGILWAAEAFAGIPVLYVHGNHEPYGTKLEKAQQEMRAAAHASGNVHFLNCDEHLVGDVRFLGCTLWTDFKLLGDEQRRAAMAMAGAELNDYKRIRLESQGYRKLRPSDTALLHSQHRSWLEERLSIPFHGKTVVITHMAPSILSVQQEHINDTLSGAYASNLDHLVETVNLWCHGHIHETLDYRIGAGRVVCNPLGYKNKDGSLENPSFDPNFIIEV